MPDPHLYLKIAEALRREILAGQKRPGERVPPLRAMAKQWGCTIGTVQRAYHELARQGLVVSRVGQGTRVSVHPAPSEAEPLRRAILIHRAEAFLLETLSAGYSPAEVEQAVRLAMDHWQAVTQQPESTPQGILRFYGSNDLALTWLAAHFSEIAPGYSLEVRFVGSLGGLIALAEGNADLAGCHLWDEESGTYNLPFVRRLLPGKRVALLTLAQRHLGLILPAGNAGRVHRLQDLTRPGLRFVNRQSGSGTRVWLDNALRKCGLSPQNILGYDNEKMTHSEVALAIAEGQADAGLGLEASARAYGLDFVPLTQERYDLVFLEAAFHQPAIQRLIAWLGSASARQAIARLGGYQTHQSGQLQWVE